MQGASRQEQQQQQKRQTFLHKLAATCDCEGGGRRRPVRRTRPHAPFYLNALPPAQKRRLHFISRKSSHSRETLMVGERVRTYGHVCACMHVTVMVVCVHTTTLACMYGKIHIYPLAQPFWSKLALETQWPRTGISLRQRCECIFVCVLAFRVMFACERVC